MRINVVNPNTTRAMTEKIGACARAVAGPDTEVVAVNPAMGPASIESHYDEALAVPGLLTEIGRAEREGFDGHVVACFGDPGLDAARELASGPVVGIAEAAMHMATMAGRSFSVVTTLSRTVGRARDLVRRYGFSEACVSLYASDIAVLDLDDPDSDAFRVIAELCERAVARDEADSIVLGCAGMADLCGRLTDRVGVPVIDGVAASVGLVEAMVRAGVRTSKRDEYAAPPAKRYTGLLGPFALGA